MQRKTVTVLCQGIASLCPLVLRIADAAIRRAGANKPDTQETEKDLKGQEIEEVRRRCDIKRGCDPSCDWRQDSDTEEIKESPIALHQGRRIEPRPAGTSNRLPRR